MRKMILGLMTVFTALIIALTITAVPAQAAPDPDDGYATQLAYTDNYITGDNGVGADTQCGNTLFSADYQYVTGNATLDDDPVWRVMNELAYRHCWKSASNHWADPLFLKIGCRRDHDAAGYGMEAAFDPYIWDRLAHRIDPGTHHLDCNLPEQTWNTGLIVFDGMQHFKKCELSGTSVPPKFRSDVHIAIDNGVGDKDLTLAGTFWGFTGPTLVEC